MKQYEFEPAIDDPRIYARDQWAAMRDELNTTREALEAANCEAITQASLIDMLRKELAYAKDAHNRDQVALTVVRTKLKAAGMLVLDALKEEPAPEPKVTPLPEAQSIKPLAQQPAVKITAAPLPQCDDDDDNNVAELIGRLPANRWG